MKISCQVWALASASLLQLATAVPYNTPVIRPNKGSAVSAPLGNAKLLECRAGRIDTIDVDSEGNKDTDHYKNRVASLNALKAWGGTDWQGIELPEGRKTWSAKLDWNSSEECWDHCMKACLGPAMSHGFDAALCNLKAGNSFFNFHCITGYTPNYDHICGTSERLSNGFCKIPFNDHVSKGEERHPWLLSDANGNLAQPPEIWGMDEAWGSSNSWSKTKNPKGDDDLLPAWYEDVRDYIHW